MKNQVVLVTGAGSGMGKAVALMAAERGAKVVVSDISEEAAQSVVDEIIAKSGQATAIKCDVSKDAEVKAMIDRTVEVYGRLDAAFNNAGIMMPVTLIDEVSEELYDRIMNINLKGVWLCMKYEIQQMKKQDSGAIVNNSSIGGLVGGLGLSTYHAAKHGVLGLTKGAAVEYASHGIQINAVCPGTIETPMVDDMIKSGKFSEEAFKNGTPIKRLGKVEEIAETVLWLFSPAASYITGQPISVDGGLSIV
ncbi:MULTISPECIES: SDR family NAD(P)-dependent oxidoreductase [Chryseobacterium]|uniref:SDR family NAD(P)-dependent oxidoreductase n=1 Tax=Chryseobacterium TaxID=59732 RepID=UPI001957E3A3|nr:MULTISPECIES: glucose 1-dehydrogenase [Chryseobacterium]MBM7421323.1 NAD(P)-dependent dehydrogenase (short-subunit alcohol dehydrogenase family) [Chryseobacterium sp. JUb44]MDH6211284.1 NAD(P)-dependent dehydrogenase (short-subunit alcohol dehydrogenase family) [Chryseobacterium sp. BIGb0186]WSO09943.1 glucose 1-dehydrogenase [Chryseobacterium scophthalmum]